MDATAIGLMGTGGSALQRSEAEIDATPADESDRPPNATSAEHGSYTVCVWVMHAT